MNTTFGDEMATNSTFCQVREFKPKNESITAYLERVSLFFDINEIAEGKQVTWLLNMLGAITYSLVRTLVAPAEPKSKSMEELTQVLKQHFELKRLVIASRFYFYCRDQAAEESVADYMAELRRLAVLCDFRDFLNDALWDRLVCRLRNEGAQKQLLSEADLLLTKALTIVQSLEAAEVESHSLKAEKLPVHQIKGGGGLVN